jgi:hypothetical protein
VADTEPEACPRLVLDFIGCLAFHWPMQFAMPGRCSCEAQVRAFPRILRNWMRSEMSVMSPVQMQSILFTPQSAANLTRGKERGASRILRYRCPRACTST